MPRIFRVTFTREFECTLLAESLEEAKAALEDQDHEFDEWAGADAGWETYVIDPYMGSKSASEIPKVFKAPNMGVLDGECVNILDYQKEHPDYLDKVKADADEVALKLNLNKTVAPLFPGES